MQTSHDINSPSERVAKSALEFGNKAANLQELESVCEIVRKKYPSINIDVPEIKPLSHDFVQKHLDAYAPTWRILWKDFLNAQGEEKDSLVGNAKPILEKLQKLILQTFADNPIDKNNKNLFDEYFKSVGKDSLLMVRSTGKEDNVNFANPGGNESVAAVKADVHSVSMAMGVVVASYFSEKSLSQRLISKDDIRADPFMPVLLQKMIGEPLNGAKKSEDIVTSGVMYTGKYGLRMQVAPGHGELVVNSKAPFDSIYVTEEDVVHIERANKEIRYVPEETKELDKVGNPKRKLVARKNPRELAQAPALTDEVAQQIAEVGRIIQEHYQMPMDVEFVYDPKENKISLVQARPIPKGDNKLVPSSVPPEKLPKLKELKKRGEVTEALVITPARFAAQVVTKKSEILICHSIDIALAEYLAQKNSQVKAAIIQDSSGDTTHEAAQFSMKAIPVLRVPDIKETEKLRDQSAPVIIVDPQRSQVIDWTKHVKNHANAVVEAFDEKEGILKVGLYKTPMPSMSLPESQSQKTKDFIRTRVQAFRKKLTYESKHIKESKRQSADKLGQLIVKVRSEDEAVAEAALLELSNRLFSLLTKNSRDTVVNQKNLYQDLLENLQKIESASAGKANEEAFAAITNILASFGLIAKIIPKIKAHAPHQSLFKQALILGAEITQCLEKFSRMTETDPDKDDRQKELLRLIAMLESFIKNPGHHELITASIKQIAQDAQAIKTATTQLPYINSDPELKKELDNLTEEQLEVFSEFAKLKKLALNQRFEQEWIMFALNACQDPSSRHLLSQIIFFNNVNGIDADWLNLCFAKHMEEYVAKFKSDLKEYKEKKKSLGTTLANNDKKDSKTVPKSTKGIRRAMMREILVKIKNESVATATDLEKMNLSSIQTILNSWERRIGEWADPNKFEQLWKEYAGELLPLIGQINFSDELQPLAKKAVLKTVQHMTEVMDRTIKSLKGSSNYEESDRLLQVERFAQLLEPYHNLMQKWVRLVPDSYFENWSRSVVQFRYLNLKEGMCWEIDDTFQLLKTRKEAAQLNASQFEVSSAKIGSTASFARQFRGLRNTLTLEDLFSLFHQNILTSTVLLGQDVRIKKEDLPDEIRSLLVKFEENNVQLLSMDHVYPKVIFDYNMPLSNHSAKFIFEYDQVSHKIILRNKIFGMNWQNRMEIIADIANFESQLLKVVQVKKPRYNDAGRSLEFEWEFDAREVPRLAEPIKEALDSYGQLTFSASTRDGLIRLLQRYPESNTEIINKLLIESVRDEGAQSAVLKELISNYKLYPVKLLKQILDTIPIRNFSSRLQSAEITLYQLDNFLDETKVDLTEKCNDGFTLFEKILMSNLCNPDVTSSLIKKLNIKLEHHPNIIKVALLRADSSLYHLLVQGGALIPDYLEDDVIAEAFKNHELRKIILNIFQNNTGMNVTSRKTLIRDLLSQVSVGEAKEAVVLVQDYLKLGAPVELNAFKFLSEERYPQLTQAYLNHVKEHLDEYKMADQTKVISECVHDAKMVLNLLDLGLPMGELSPEQVITLLGYKNSRLNQFCLDWLAKNAELGKQPTLQAVVDEMKTLDVDVFKTLLESQQPFILKLSLLSSEIRKPGLDILINNYLKLNDHRYKENLDIFLRDVILPDQDLHITLMVLLERLKHLFLREQDLRCLLNSPLLSVIIDQYSAEDILKLTEIFYIPNKTSVDLLESLIQVPKIRSVLQQNPSKAIFNLIVPAFKEENPIVIQFLMDAFAIDFTELTRELFPEFKESQEGKLSPLWEKILANPSLNFLLSEKYFTVTHFDDLKLFFELDVKLILYLLDKNPDLINEHRPNFLLYCKTPEQLNALITHKNFKIPDFDQAYNDLLENPSISYEFRSEIFKIGYSPSSGSLIFSDYLKYQHDAESKDHLKPLSEVIKEGDLKSFHYYIQHGLELIPSLLSMHSLILALMHKQYEIALQIFKAMPIASPRVACWVLDSDDGRLHDLLLSAAMKKFPILIAEPLAKIPKPPDSIYFQNDENAQTVFRSETEVDTVSYLLERGKTDLALKFLKLPSYQIPEGPEHLARLSGNIKACQNAEMIALYQQKVSNLAGEIFNLKK